MDKTFYCVFRLSVKWWYSRLLSLSAELF